jgi:hypothetical protein
MKRGPLLLAVSVGLILLGAGCGSSDSSSPGAAKKPMVAQQRARQHGRHQAKKRRAVARHRARVRARQTAARRRIRHERRLEARQERREARLLARAEQREAAEAEVAVSEEQASECDPNYEGACLDPYASDYDCEGGSGNGPEYTGTVTVVGEDHYGLDADGDGIGCEAE